MKTEKLVKTKRLWDNIINIIGNSSMKNHLSYYTTYTKEKDDNYRTIDFYNPIFDDEGLKTS